MKRYIKIKGKWIDTLVQQKNGYYYYIIGKKVYCLPESTMVDYIVGRLQDETDDSQTALITSENKKDKD